MTQNSDNNMRNKAQQFFEDAGVPRWLVTGGLNSLLGILLAMGILGIFYLYQVTALITIPLIVAAVIAVVAHPLVKFGDRIRLPRIISSVLVVILVAGLAWAAVHITVAGVVDRGPDIAYRLTTGVNELADYTKDALINLGVDEAVIDENIQQITDGITNPASLLGLNGDGQNNGAADPTYNIDTRNLGGVLTQGFAGIGRILSGVTGAIFSLFIGIVFLFYFLNDYERIRGWLANNMFRDKKLGEGVIHDATTSLGGYFRAMTLTGFIVAVAVGVCLWILGVPLVMPIVIVTFLTGYIPFLGAIIASAFAILIALADGGIAYALIVLLVMVIANNVLQTLVANKLLGDNLNLHPLAVMLVTLFGAVAAGILGGTMAAPFLATAIAIRKRIGQIRSGELSDDELMEQIEQIHLEQSSLMPASIRKLFEKAKDGKDSED